MLLNTKRCPQIFYVLGQPIEIPPNTAFDDGTYPQGRSCPGMAPINLPEHFDGLPAGTHIYVRRQRSLLDTAITYAVLCRAAERWSQLSWHALLHADANLALPASPLCDIYQRNLFPDSALGLYLNHVSGVGPTPELVASGLARFFGVELDAGRMIDEIMLDLAVRAEGQIGKTDVPPEVVANEVMLVESLQHFRVPNLKHGAEVLLFRKWGGLGDQVMLGMTISDLRRQRPDLKITVAVPREFLPLWEQHGVTMLPAERLTARYLWKFHLVRDCSFACSEFPLVAQGKKITTHRSERWATHIGFELKSAESDYAPTAAEIAWVHTQLGPKTQPWVGIAPNSVTSWRSYPFVKELAAALSAEGFRVLGLHSRPLPLPPGTQPTIPSYRLLGAVISQLDALVTVPTSQYCFANVLHVPTVAIFGTEDKAAFAHKFPECTYLGYDLGRGCPCWGTKANNCLSSGTTVDCMIVPVAEVMSAVRDIFSKRVPCICGQTKLLSLGRKDGLRLARCPDCGTVVSVDLPRDQEQLLRLYTDYALGYHTEWQRGVGHLPYTERYAHDYQLAQGRLALIAKHGERGGKLLDIGCSNGAFVAAAEEAGFAACGFEVNQEIADWARRRKITVHSGPSLHQAGFVMKTFNVITAHDVIEHFADPAAELAFWRELLIPGGLLVIDTPDSWCDLAIDEGLDYRHYRPREHTFVFSEKSLTKMIAVAGFLLRSMEHPIPGKLVAYCVR